MPGALRTHTPTTDDEADLVAAARSDRRAFGPLYRRYVDPVYRYCYRRLGTREAAEDAAAQVFAQALAGLPRLGEQPFRAWLFAIAHNVVADAQRARRPTAPLAAAETLADWGPGPEDQAILAEAGRTIRALLARLPEEQRRLLELRLAGLTDAEIARVLGRSHGAVRTAQYRAVLRLRELRRDAGEPREVPDA